MSKEYREAKFKLFGGHIFPRVHNILNKDFGDYQLSIFDSKAGKSITICFIFSSQLAKFPSFELYPKNINNKLNIPILKSKRFSFPQNPDFSKKYLLNGKDEREIRDFFNNELLVYLLEIEGLIIEGKGNNLLMYYEDIFVTPDRITQHIEMLKGVYEHFWNKVVKI